MIELKPNIYKYDNYNNIFYIMREDLQPFSFGGNKVRKNLEFFRDINEGSFNHIVTYGSNHSNHARIVANLCSRYNLKCTIVTPTINTKPTHNTIINKNLNVSVIYTHLDNVKKSIQSCIKDLKLSGEKPYFIPGGAHGYFGTKAYVDCFDDVINYSNLNQLEFDYIFLASGTGATQAGIVIGNYLNKKDIKIIGISVARTEKYGKSVIQDSIREYFEHESLKAPDIDITFLDNYLSGGYGKYNDKIELIIKKYLKMYGIPLDPVYTGKAAYGMHEYLKINEIENKKILFIHTGGTPLFFDYIQEKKND